MNSWVAALSQTVQAAIAPGQSGIASAQQAYSQASAVASGQAPADAHTATTVAASSAHAVQGVAGEIAAIAGLPMELLNTGLALITNPISAALPSLPAATIYAPYVGMPHGHLHPPSLVPPAPVPIPLPSLGAITLGASYQVLVGGLPAARAGSIGLAPTCGGLVPMFNVFLGSSKVFIGGQRAARMYDVCLACTKVLCSCVAAASSVLNAVETAGNVALVAGMAGDALDAASAGSGAEAAASAMSAAMAGVQAAADAIAGAAAQLLGSDLAVPPGLPGTIMMGAPTVLIGGMPMPNTPDIAHHLLKKLRRRRPRIAAGIANALVLGPSAGCS